MIIKSLFAAALLAAPVAVMAQDIPPPEPEQATETPVIPAEDAAQNAAAQPEAVPDATVPADSLPSTNKAQPEKTEDKPD